MTPKISNALSTLREGSPGRREVAPKAATGELVIQDLTLAFRDQEVVRDVSLSVDKGQFVCLLGPSGGGKSTLLNAIAGFLRPARGRIVVDGEPVTGPGPARGMVFQEYSLFPWKTVAENIAFGPRMSGKGSVVSESISRTFLGLVGLSHCADRYPATLSGGMQQRVSIARALANYPSMLLMDEPFGALDAQTRLMMQEQLLTLWRDFRITVMFVTHDIDEAIALADRIVVLGGSPATVVADLEVGLERPRTHQDLGSRTALEIRRQCLDLIREETLKCFRGLPETAVGP